MKSLHRIRRALMVTALVVPVIACAPNPPVLITSAPSSVETTDTYKTLRNLPAPKMPVPVAVYSYPDLTGQFKPTETVSTNSRAVTQGAVWMLVKALKDAAGGQWFKVIQRANLDNLLKERQIIRETRGRIEKTSGRPQPSLPSLLFAGVILEGGIIGYDSNTVTGGLGARYLGIGGDVQYRQDTVTVYLNAISSQTGEVLKSVMTRKTVASYGVRGSVFKFVAFQKLLEGETGYTINEPGQIAVAQAIEHSVRALIIEGALEGLWQFENQVAGKEETQAYLADREDNLLLGDATSETALALLTDEQLRELAKRQRERRQLSQIQVASAKAIREAASEMPPEIAMSEQLPPSSKQPSRKAVPTAKIPIAKVEAPKNQPSTAPTVAPVALKLPTREEAPAAKAPGAKVEAREVQRYTAPAVEPIAPKLAIAEEREAPLLRSVISPTPRRPILVQPIAPLVQEKPIEPTIEATNAAELPLATAKSQPVQEIAPQIPVQEIVEQLEEADLETVVVQKRHADAPLARRPKAVVLNVDLKRPSEAMVFEKSAFQRALLAAEPAEPLDNLDAAEKEHDSDLTRRAMNAAP